MEMHQVRYFLAVCEHLSFTQAARRCHVTQPSLTRAIQLLEKEFGGRLFHRERSRIHLTELGRIVRPYLQEAWENTEVAKQQAKDHVSTQHGIAATDSRDFAGNIVRAGAVGPHVAARRRLACNPAAAVAARRSAGRRC